jgi:hypothetical protein
MPQKYTKQNSFFKFLLGLLFLFFLKEGCGLSGSTHSLPLNNVTRGVWVNLWNYPQNAKSFIDELSEKGINTLYLELSRSDTEEIKFPQQVRQIIAEAQNKNIAVIGWTYALMNDPQRDALRYAANARIVGLAGMAVDLEEKVNKENVTEFVQTAKKELGEKYPLIAITYSPSLRPINGAYPWRTIAKEFKIIAPMLYWHTSTKNPAQIYQRTCQDLDQLKALLSELKRDPSALHPIGDSHSTNKEEVKAFLQACTEKGVLQNGISLYPLHLSQEESLQALSSEQLLPLHL